MDAFLTQAEVDEINAIRRQAFNTRLMLQNPRRTIVLDRNGAAVPAQEVVIEWANLQPERAGMGPTDVFLAGPAGMGTIRGDIDVASDGQSWTASYTLELIGPDGASTGEIGPGMASATRIMVESQGTPVGSFEDIFGAPPATPASTPAG